MKQVEKVARNFVVMIFPTEEKLELRDQLMRLHKALTAACVDPVQLIHPSEKAMLILARGDKLDIARAIEDARSSSTSFMILPIEEGPIIAGLSKSADWLRRHQD